MFFRTRRSGRRTYVQIVENESRGGRMKQRVLLKLGRLDRLREAGRLEALIESGGRLADSLAVLSTYSRAEPPAVRTHSLAALVFEGLWERSAYAHHIAQLSSDEAGGDRLHRALYRKVLHFLVHPDASRRLPRLPEDDDAAFAIAPAETLRALQFLGENAKGRSRRAELESALFEGGRDLFSNFGLTLHTSIPQSYRVCVAGGQNDIRELRLLTLFDDRGRILSCEAVSHEESCEHAAARLHQRFGVAFERGDHDQREAVSDALCRSLVQHLRLWPALLDLDKALDGLLVCLLLAEQMRSEVLHRLQQSGWRTEWPQVLEAIDELRSVALEKRGKRFEIVSEGSERSVRLLSALGVELQAGIRRR